MTCLAQNSLTISTDPQTFFLFLALCLIALTFRPQFARTIDRLRAVEFRGFRAWFQDPAHRSGKTGGPSNRR